MPKGITYMMLRRLNSRKKLKNTLCNALLLTLMLLMSIGVFSLNANVSTKDSSVVTRTMHRMECASSEFELGDVVETETAVYLCDTMVFSAQL